MDSERKRGPHRRARRLAVIGLALLPLAAFAPAAAAEDVRIDASLSDEAIYEGESFTLNLTIVGPMRGIGTPELPELGDFALVGTSSSTSYSIVNGSASGSKSFSYSLIPLKAGDLEIPAIGVMVKDKTFFSKALKIHVRPSQGGGAPSGRGQGPAVQPSQPPAGGNDAQSQDGRVFIRSWVDRKKVFVGQQLTHHFALYRDPRVGLLGQPQYVPPDLKGFWAESLGDEISGFRAVEGRDYAATELRSALFPQEPGNMKIGSATLRIRLRGSNTWDLFSFNSGSERVLRSPEIEVEVQPLPAEGKPVGFSGTVASDLSLDARLDKGPYMVGQPASLTVVLAGVGNPRAFSEPTLPASDDFKYYDPELASETSVNAEKIRVRKTFTRIVVPKRDGELTLPGLSYAWFDPEQGRYRTAQTRELVLSVTPSTSAETNPMVFTDLTPERVKLLGQAIHHIKTSPLLAGDGQRFPRSPGFWTALVLPWPLLAGAWLWRLQRERLLSDKAGYRARGARRGASRRLRSAAAARAASQFDSFCTELAAGLRGYLADRLNLSAAGLTSDQAEAGLAAAGASEALRQETVSLLADCDFARYAPGSERNTKMDALYERAESLLAGLEGEIGRKARRSHRFPSILPLLSLCIILAFGRGAFAAMPLDAEARMERAAGLYEQSDFAGAIAVWNSLAAEGVEDSRLWYNLGNAHFQRGDIGRAVLAYRRAERLAPRDKEIRDNLALARARREEGMTHTDLGLPGRAWEWVRDNYSPGEMAVAGLIVLWLSTLSLLALIFRRLSWRRLRWILLPAFVLLPLISIAAWAAERQDWSGREAVLLAPSVVVQSGPGAGYITLFEIHEGAELNVREQRGDWIRVHLGENLEGWIPRQAAETL